MNMLHWCCLTKLKNKSGFNWVKVDPFSPIKSLLVIVIKASDLHHYYLHLPNVPLGPYEISGANLKLLILSKINSNSGDFTVFQWFSLSPLASTSRRNATGLTGSSPHLSHVLTAHNIDYMRPIFFRSRMFGIPNIGLGHSTVFIFGVDIGLVCFQIGDVFLARPLRIYSPPAIWIDGRWYSRFLFVPSSRWRTWHSPCSNLEMGMAQM